MLPKDLQLTDEQRYGALLSKDILIHRKYFEEMVNLIGIKVIYYAPKPGRRYTTWAEMDTNFQPPEIAGVIFEEHPDQKSLRKMGWNAELQENASILHIAYDLTDIQRGALFLIPSGLDHTKGRLFRVNELKNSIVYPASITCEIVPEYEDIMPTSKLDRSYTDFNLLRAEDEEP